MGSFPTCSAIIILTTAIGGCDKLRPPGNPRSPRHTTIVDLNSPGYLDRSKDRTSAGLSFTTTEPAECEVYLSIRGTAGPGHANGLTIPCPSQEMQKKFSLTLTPLDKDGSYTVEILAWPVGAKRGDFEPYVFEELQGGHTFFGKQPVTSPGAITELLIAKIDLPLGSGHVYRHELPRATKQVDMTQTLNRETGCSDSSPAVDRFSLPAPLARIEGVMTRGFATGRAVDETRSDSIVTLEFSKNLQLGDQWEWNFRYLNASFALTTRPSATLTSLQVRAEDIAILDRTNFEKGLRELAVNVKQPLTISWKTANSTKNSYVTIQLGHSSLKAATFCTFLASAESATINPSYLERLSEGAHYLYVALEDQRFQFGSGRDEPAWFFSSRDWRALKIVRQ